MIDLDPLAADESQPIGLRQQSLDLGPRKGFPVERHLHLEVEQRIHPELRRRLAADRRLHLRARRAVHAPARRHANDHAGAFQRRAHPSGIAAPVAGSIAADGRFRPHRPSPSATGNCSAARWTGISSDSRRSRFFAPAYSCSALPSGRCCALATAERRVVYVARNANGASSSFRFSARLKCTRPTRFQAG